MKLFSLLAFISFPLFSLADKPAYSAHQKKSFEKAFKWAKKEVYSKLRPALACESDQEVKKAMVTRSNWSINRMAYELSGTEVDIDRPKRDKEREQHMKSIDRVFAEDEAGAFGNCYKDFKEKLARIQKDFSFGVARIKDTYRDPIPVVVKAVKYKNYDH